MKHKTILIVLFVAFAVAVVILIFVKKNAGANNATTPAIVDNTNSLTQGSNTPVVLNPDSNVVSFPLKKGSYGKAVKMIQASVGATVDGIWGNNTETAIYNYNGSHEISQTDFINAVGSITQAKYQQFFPLQYGSKGDYVKDVQILVGVTPDGIWGTQTQNAVQLSMGKVVLDFSDYIALLNKTLGLSVSPVISGSAINQLSVLKPVQGAMFPWLNFL